MKKYHPQRIKIISFSLFIFAICNISAGAQSLRDADLVFQLGASGGMGSAIAESTDRGEGPVVHVGIFAVIDGVPSVVEASPASGVTVTPMARYIADARSGGAIPCVKVMRIAGVDARATITKALSYLGRPYDRAFAPGDDALYCSELVYECCVDASGERVFDAAPMNFLAADGTMPLYWTRHFEALGVAVPQGVSGTNPAAMSVSPRLVPVTEF